MAAIGQAQANAGHIADFMALCRPPAGARVLVAGAGTGQMFDSIAPALFQDVRAVFADINPEFLACLRARCQGALCVADDLERSALKGDFHAACAVLVLEHIDWRKGLDTLAALAPQWLFLVVQVNPAEMATAVTPARRLPGSMEVFSKVHPELRDPEEVIGHLSMRGYELAERRPRPVADGKTMLGLPFTRRAE
jgi:SAM-dependent methyltransferase